MCGRFALTMPTEAMESVFNAAAGDVPEGPRYNICPTQEIVVVVSHEGERHLTGMRWGFLPRWYKAPNDGPLLINARSETIAEKPAFRDAARSRRCLIPASGFYEWTASAGKGKEPWYMSAPDGGLLAFAGIWQSWQDGDGQRLVSAAIVTTQANDMLSAIHHRMPVLIRPEDQALWLGEAGKGAATLMQPAPEEALQRHRVSRRVNGMRGDDPDLIVPFED